MHLRKQEAGLSKQDIVDWHVSAQTEIADHGREGEVRVVRSVLKDMLHTDHSLETANDVGGGGEPTLNIHCAPTIHCYRAIKENKVSY